MPEINKGRVLAGRKAIEAYRASHSMLYTGGYYKGISDDHTPLLNILKEQLAKCGFNSLQEFFDASEELNIQELGLEGKELTDVDMIALEEKWK